MFFAYAHDIGPASKGSGDRQQPAAVRVPPRLHGPAFLICGEDPVEITRDATGAARIVSADNVMPLVCGTTQFLPEVFVTENPIAMTDKDPNIALAAATTLRVGAQASLAPGLAGDLGDRIIVHRESRG